MSQYGRNDVELGLALGNTGMQKLLLWSRKQSGCQSVLCRLKVHHDLMFGFGIRFFLMTGLCLWYWAAWILHTRSVYPNTRWRRTPSAAAARSLPAPRTASHVAKVCWVRSELLYFLSQWENFKLAWLRYLVLTKSLNVLFPWQLENGV